MVPINWLGADQGLSFYCLETARPDKTGQKARPSLPWKRIGDSRDSDSRVLHHSSLCRAGLCPSLPLDLALISENKKSTRLGYHRIRY